MTALTDSKSTRKAALKVVEDWSLRIHDARRHQWCMSAARAIVDGHELPASGKGTAFSWRSTAEARVETIRRLIAETLAAT